MGDWQVVVDVVDGGGEGSGGGSGGSASGSNGVRASKPLSLPKPSSMEPTLPTPNSSTLSYPTNGTSTSAYPRNSPAKKPSTSPTKMGNINTTNTTGTTTTGVSPAKSDRGIPSMPPPATNAPNGDAPGTVLTVMHLYMCVMYLLVCVCMCVCGVLVCVCVDSLPWRNILYLLPL